MLEEHPLAGRGRDEIRPGLRSALSTPYVIFYRIRDNAPEVVRVLDGRRDIDEIFSDESQQSSSKDG
jgi:toxin ParE1/3/4